MQLNRRQFMDRSVMMFASGGTMLAAQRLMGSQPPGPRFSETPDQIIDLKCSTADELQRSLFQHRNSKKTLRLPHGISLKCPVREDRISDETSAHPLLVPEGVSLDLNDSTLLLDLRSNSYGIRLSNDSAIRNGTIRIVASENKGSQACWHSGVSVGAAYGDGGTTARPGYFTTVKHWAIQNLTIDQPFAASAIQLMSEACHGIIRNIRILDSAKALLGVGMDWGGVGPMTSEDREIPRMRKLWEQGQIFSTHPHDIQVERIHVGKLTRNVDGNDAGVRCSACHNITIRQVEIAEAATAVAIFGGDLGYEFARNDQRTEAHQGYVIEDVKIAKALRYGLVMNGSADNVWRATRSHQYEPIRDPVNPGLDQPRIRRLQLHGPGMTTQSQGIYAVSLTKAVLEDIQISHFNLGVHVEDWVHGMKFRNTKFNNNQADKRIEGATVPATQVEFSD